MYIPIYSMMSSQIRTYRWDLAVTTGIQDGQGTWNTTNTYFSNDNGATRIAWVPGSIAQFGGGSSGTAGGNIVTGTQTCTGLIFNTPFAGSYTFGGGTIAFIGASFIECNSATGMIGSGMLSGGTITVRGTATFTIAGSSAANTIDTLNVTSGATVAFTAAYTVKLPTSSLIVGGTVSFAAATSATTISCVISGAGTITSSNASGGSSDITVLANNTFTGTWTHNGTGNLRIGNGSAATGDVGTCSLVLNAPAIFQRVATWTLTANVSGTGTATLSNGDMTLTGAWTAGAISISSGTTIRIGAGGTVGSCSANLSNAGAKVFNRSNAYTYPGVISGAGTVTHSGSGTLTFSANQTYTGTTTISAGPLRLGGTLAATAITVANTTGASIGASTAATRTIAGSVTFAGSNAALDVQTNGTTVASRLTVTGGVVRGGAKVNVLGALNAGSYIIISGASGSSSGAEFTIGTNLSGRTCTFSTVSGVTTMTAT
jgi:fibronectin-binding autotransporter adhesin